MTNTHLRQFTTLLILIVTTALEQNSAHAERENAAEASAEVEVRGDVSFGAGYFNTYFDIREADDDVGLNPFASAYAENVYDDPYPDVQDWRTEGSALSRPERLVVYGGNIATMPTLSLGVGTRSSLLAAEYGNWTEIRSSASASLTDFATFAYIPVDATELHLVADVHAIFQTNGPLMRTNGFLGINLASGSESQAASINFDGRSTPIGTGFNSLPILPEIGPRINYTVDEAIVHLAVPITPEIRALSGFEFGMWLRAESSVNDVDRPRPIGETQDLRVSAQNTASLTSLLFGFPDGSRVTPESLGISVVFDSGAISPNLITLVPETGGFTLLGTAAGIISLAFGFVRVRQCLNRRDQSLQVD